MGRDRYPGLLVVPDGLEMRRSLGWQMVDWYETMLCHGPGDVQGDDLHLDDEIVAFIVRLYGLNEHGRRLVNYAVLSRSKGRAKSEVAGMVACGEAFGPCRFDHWAARGETSWWGYRYDEGEPVGRTIRSPFVRILATEEGQTGNTYDNVRTMLTQGKIAELVEGIDVGLTRTFGPNSAEIRPSTAGASSKDGGKESCAIADEPHLYVLQELISMHDTVTRNLTKRKIAEPFMLDTTTAFLVGQESVAEAAMQYAREIAAGTKRNRGLLYDHRQGRCKDWADDAQVLAGLVEAYGDAAGFVDFERILAEIRNPKTREVDGRRYFLNEPARHADRSWLPPGEWERRRVDGAKVDLERPFVATVDMALRHDTCSVRAFQLTDTGSIITQAWPFIPDGGPLDIVAIENQIRTFHRTGNLGEVAYDPAFFERSAQVLSDEGVLMVEFPQSAARMVPACGLAYEQILAGNVIHDDDPVSTDQVTAAVPRESENGWRLSKGRSKKKIGAAITLVIGIARVLARPDTPEPSPEPVFMFSR